MLVIYFHICCRGGKDLISGSAVQSADVSIEAENEGKFLTTIIFSLDHCNCQWALCALSRTSFYLN